jgi:hypothetical protein
MVWLFVIFEPDRSKHVSVELPPIRDFGSILLTPLDPDRDPTDNSSRAYRHSGCGDSLELDPLGFVFSIKTADDGEASEIVGVHNDDVSKNWVCDQLVILAFGNHLITCLSRLLCLCLKGSVNTEVIKAFVPSCLIHRAAKKTPGDTFCLSSQDLGKGRIIQKSAVQNNPIAERIRRNKRRISLRGNAAKWRSRVCIFARKSTRRPVVTVVGYFCLQATRSGMCKGTRTTSQNESVHETGC